MIRIADIARRRRHPDRGVRARASAIGTLINAPTKTRDILDPTTNEVIDHRVLEWIVLKVTATGRTADCVPNVDADGAKLELPAHQRRDRIDYPEASGPEIRT